MQIITATNKEKGPGYAVFTLTRLSSSDSFPPLDEGTSLILQSSSNRAYWADGKWVQGKTTFKPDGFEIQGAQLLVYLGPSIVDHLDPMETYLLCLVGSDGTECCSVFYLENVQPSSVRGSAAPEVPQPEVAPTIPTFPTPQEAPKVEPVVEPVITPAPEPTPEVVEPLPQVEPLLEQPAPTTPAGTPKGAIIGGVVLLLLLIGGGAYWFLGKGEKTPPVSLASIRSMIVEKAPDEKLRTVFTTTEWTPENADARFLLAEVLAQKNDKDAMLVLAQFYDPANTVIASGSIVKDAEQAYTWYTAAQKQGVDVKAPLESLRSWVAKQADAGDADAKDLQKRMQ